LKLLSTLALRTKMRRYTKVRAQLKEQLGGYVQHASVTTPLGLGEFVVTSRHGNDAGLVGALALAVRASEREAGGVTSCLGWDIPGVGMWYC